MLFFGSPGVDFDPARDIPSLDGKVILVTGGNSGLGAESIKQLALHSPSHIYLCARSLTTAESTVSAIHSSLPPGKAATPIDILPLDLGKFDSVKKCAEKFLEKETRLDILLLNAGIAFEGAALTDDGYELQFGTNHMGHALLTKLLMPTLLQTAAEPDTDVRVISVASYGHHQAPTQGILFDTLKTPQSTLFTFTRYGQSKLANILFTHSLATHYPTLTCASIHPGSVGTSIGRDAQKKYPRLTALLMKFLRATVLVDVSVGARNQLWAATAGELRGRRSGGYYEPVGVEGREGRLAGDEALAGRLWEWTEGEFVEKGVGKWPAAA